MTDQVFCILDYETRSRLDVKDVGGYEYACHPSTEVLCVCWKIGTKKELLAAPVEQWCPLLSPSIPPSLVKAFYNRDVILVAHNAFFEQCVTRYVLRRHLDGFNPNRISDHTRWMCTAAMAAAMALPRKLVDAGAALGLRHQKNMDGHRLMLKMAKPRRATKNDDSPWHESPEDLKKLVEYCVDDVKSETELFLALPVLNNQERAIWCLDQKINFRGFKVDRLLVNNVLRMIEQEKDRLNTETIRITNGIVESTTQRARTKGWLEAQGLFLPNMQAKTVEDTLAANLAMGPAKRVLEIRQAIAKSSTAKYVAFEERSRSDGRVRDHLLYHGATTGRWSGRGAQIHNLPRGKIKNATKAAEMLLEGDLDLVHMLYNNPMDVFSSCLRGVVLPSDGMELFCSDFSAIEARVLFWLADHEKGLEAYHQGVDLYIDMAAAIYGKPKHEIGPKSFERVLGKKSILGMGYGMGADKFQASCKGDGIEISDELSKKAVITYRETHHPVPVLWKNLERAAIGAILDRTKKIKIAHTAWWMQGRYLMCELPSGRRLAYPGAEVRYEIPSWGGDRKRPTLYYWGQNPKTKKWEIGKSWGGVLTENVDQAIARDLMASAMWRVENAKYPVLMTVHDEVLSERRTGEGNLGEFEKLMTRLPTWGQGIPINVESWQWARYRKG